MSIARRLLCIGLPAALLVGAASPCRADTAPLDIQDNDTTARTAPAHVPSAQPLYTVIAGVDASFEIPLPGRHADTVTEITPDYRADIQERKRLNRDVVGWLHVPGTDIDREILQNPAENNPCALENDYYLTRDFYGQPSRDGVFCADYRARFGPGGRDDLARVTTIYGHSWNDDPDGTLFAQLKKYRDPDFAREHPYIYFSTAAEDMVWEVFAVYDTTIYLPYIRPGLPLKKYYQVLDMIYDLSYYRYDAAIGDYERILALSTCTFSVDGHPALPEVNEYRFVVMARLTQPDEARKDSAVFVANDSRLPPDATRSLSAL